MTDETITIKRHRDEDASQAAARAARMAGTRIAGNLRWSGLHAPLYRECATANGRTIRVIEPQ